MRCLTLKMTISQRSSSETSSPTPSPPGKSSILLLRTSWREPRLCRSHFFTTTALIVSTNKKVMFFQLKKHTIMSVCDINCDRKQEICDESQSVEECQHEIVRLSDRRNKKRHEFDHRKSASILTSDLIMFCGEFFKCLWSTSRNRYLPPTEFQ